jgi:phosphoglycolate phosphatase
MLRHVFFDLDGTLTDSKEGIIKSIQFSLTSLEYPSLSELELQTFIGVPLRTIYKKLLNSSDEALIEKAVSLYRNRFSKIGIYENLVYPGITELLVALSINQ